MLRAKILGTGGYVPPRVVTNAELAEYMDTSDEWIYSRSGIRERRWVDDGTTNSDLAVEASRLALENAGLEPEDVECIIYGTLTPDIHFPGNGVFLQQKLGISHRHIPCYDIRQQCSAFVYGMEMAKAFIETGLYRNVLFVGSETHSFALERSDRGRAVTVLFGDGAGAVLIGGEETEREDDGIFFSEVHADGAGALKGIHMKVFEMNKYPFLDYDATDPGENRILWPDMIDSKNLFVNAVERMTEVGVSALKKNSLTIEDIDWLLPHQANMRINGMVAKKLGGRFRDKILYNIHKYGNTTAATIPLLLDEFTRNGTIKRGDLLLCVAFGSGFTWGGTLIRY